MSESITQLAWASSIKRQSAYATPNPLGDITFSAPFEGADFGDLVPNMSDNAAMLGKGHEFATRNEMLSWDVTFRRSFAATTKVLGWAMAFHCGTDSVTGPTNGAYTHIFEYQDPVGAGYYGSGRQQPVVTIMERVSSTLVRQFPSMCVQAVEITGTLGDFVKLAVELRGSGKKSNYAPSAYTFPDSTSDALGGELAAGLMRFGSITFTSGPSGVLTDQSCTLRSFRFRSEMQYDETGGYCPGSGYQTTGDATSGAIRNKLEFLRRAVVLEFVVTAQPTADSLFTRLDGAISSGVLINCQGALIGGSSYHRMMISVPNMKYKAIPIGADGDLITYSVQAVVFYDSLMANPFEVTVVNTTAAYLASS